MQKIGIKPLSVNEAWQGKRYKTDKYKAYVKYLTLLLKPFKMPEGDLIILFEFGFSNKSSDWDNPVKPTQDILQKKYKFNDSRAMLGIVNKVIVPKGEEYVRFWIYPYKDIFNEIINLLNK